MIALFAAGCGSSLSTTVINPAPRPMQARPPETVEIFSSGPPRRPYVDVAYLEVEQETTMSFDNTPEFINHLRHQAARMGCDGVVLGGVTNSADVTTSVVLEVNASRKGITATCIVYRPEGMAAGSPPPMSGPPMSGPPSERSPSASSDPSIASPPPPSADEPVED